MEKCRISIVLPPLQINRAMLEGSINNDYCDSPHGRLPTGGVSILVAGEAYGLVVATGKCIL